MKARVLIIEDDLDVRGSLALGLRLEGFEVLEAENGNIGLRLLEQLPDVVLLDIVLPGTDGFGILEQIRTRSSVPIMMLTALDETSAKVRGLKAGADDYVVKPYSLSEILARIEALLRRSKSEIQRSSFADVVLDFVRLEARRRGRVLEVTPKGFRLLQVLFEHPQRVMTREVLMRAVWGEEVDPNTLDALVAGLRRSLGAPNIIQTVRGVGYALRVNQ
ncbi:MAG: response regulator transcription factor [Deinococcales bacterium]